MTTTVQPAEQDIVATETASPKMSPSQEECTVRLSENHIQNDNEPMVLSVATTSFFERLPVELLCEICLWLDDRTLREMRLVNTTFSQIMTLFPPKRFNSFLSEPLTTGLLLHPHHTPSSSLRNILGHAKELSLMGMRLHENKVEAINWFLKLAPNLEVLGLLWFELDSLMISLLAFDRVPRLTALEMWGRNFGPDWVIALGRHRFPHLQRLALRYSWFGCKGAWAIAQVGFPNLQALDLTGNGITSQGAQWLSEGNFPRLACLKIGHNPIDAEGIRALCSNLSSLQRLELEDTQDVRQSGWGRLDRPDFEHLKHLNMERCYLSDTDAHVLAKANLDNLCDLILGTNVITKSGARSLANGNLRNLRHLDLSDNDIGVEGAIALANGNLKHLVKLELNRNQIGDAGAVALANGKLKHLVELNLAYNDIGDAGAMALANGNLQHLVTLRLLDNKVGDAGGLALVQGNLQNLEYLHLGMNNVTQECKRSLEVRCSARPLLLDWSRL